MENISGYRIRRKSRGALKHWAGLLEEWQLAVVRYSRITGGDAPYWYNERANVSVLAGAAWRCGWVALEEFQSEKTEVNDSGETKEVKSETWNGRCDLYLCTDYDSEVVEAKFKWISLNSRNLLSGIDDALTSATKDAANTKGNNEGRAVGVAFISFYIKSEHIEYVDKKIHETIELFSTVTADCVGWCFPEIHRKTAHGEYNYLKPGVAIFARLAT